MLNAARSITYAANYDPYGQVMAQYLPDATPSFGFTGQMTDASGLQYLRARYYDPSLGAFLSQDPKIGAYPQLSASWNGYSYAHGNPTTFIDPSGEIPLVVALPIIVGGLFGANEFREQVYHNQTQGMSFWDAVYHRNIDFRPVAYEAGKGAVVGAIGRFNWWIAGFGSAASAPAWVPYAVGAASGASTNILGGIIGGRYDYDFSQSASSNLSRLGTHLGVDTVTGGFGGALFTGFVGAPLNYVRSRQFLTQAPLTGFFRGINNVTRNVIAARAVGAGVANATQGIAARGINGYILGDESARYDSLGEFVKQFAIDFSIGASVSFGFDRFLGQSQATGGAVARMNVQDIRRYSKVRSGMSFGTPERKEAIIKQLRNLVAIDRTFYGNQARQSFTNIIATTNVIIPLTESSFDHLVNIMEEYINDSR